jgi:hypothetical protein
MRPANDLNCAVDRALCGNCVEINERGSVNFPVWGDVGLGLVGHNLLSFQCDCGAASRSLPTSFKHSPGERVNKKENTKENQEQSLTGIDLAMRGKPLVNTKTRTVSLPEGR